MGRKKLSDPSNVLTRHVSFRVNQADWLQLERLRKQSDCRTIGEVVRRILSRQKIVYFHKDASMDAPMEVLSAVREELRRIGVNINQVTRYFNSCKSDTEKNSYGIRVAEMYASVDPKVKLIMGLIAQMSRKWLQK